MKKISLKLGILFLVFILLIESMLFFFLYMSITGERVKDETDNLLARGMNHRDILEMNFDQSTIEHITVMEKEALTIVVITDENFQIIDQSNKVTDQMQLLIDKGKHMDFSHHGMLIEDRWRTEPYLATISPININNKNKGYVYMFVPTEPIRNMIGNITMSFVVVGGVALLISIITILFLSQFITRPLLKMTEATEQLSKGNNSVTLDMYRDDELGDLARSIQTLSANLEHLREERKEFLSSISHELRTPLTYLKGYADMLNRPNTTQSNREKFANIIQEESTNLTEMVKDLFLLAQMDQNYFLIKKERVNLKSFLQEVIDKVKPTFTQNHIHLKLLCEQDIFLNIDPNRFRQVIHNLISNALKYSNPHSTVTISVVNQKENINIYVKDEGKGIPQKDLPYIFDRLYRVEKSRSRSYGGSGLGLTIVKEIVEKHGGTIEVKSVLEKGTVFTITLPLE